MASKYRVKPAFFELKLVENSVSLPDSNLRPSLVLWIQLEAFKHFSDEVSVKKSLTRFSSAQEEFFCRGLLIAAPWIRLIKMTLRYLGATRSQVSIKENLLSFDLFKLNSKHILSR